MNASFRSIIATTIVLSVFMFSISCKQSTVTADSETTTHGIIPLPKSLVFSKEKLTIGKDFNIAENNQFKLASLAANDLFFSLFGTGNNSENNANTTNGIVFKVEPGLNGEAYQLEVNSTGIVIKASTDAGAFWAVQSLKQYIWNSVKGQKNSSFQLQGIQITDEPKYEWRGFHLDVSRHMFTKEYLLKIIDWLAYYKFNKFHLHLTDDQGWRIESKKLPLLNEVGSWRIFDRNDSICMRKAKTNSAFEIDPRFIKVRNGKTVYGGFYTQDDLKEIIAYAANHFIEIIPEIDMPGHMSAAIRAYPRLSCTGTAGWGTEFSYPVCPCSNETIDFTFQIWDEIADLFPSKYVHIGADEVEKDTWKSSATCAAFMKANNLKNANEIQSFFVKKMQEHMENKGKTVIAWDDVTDDKMDSKLKIMYWRDWVKDAPAKAAANNNQIIFTRWDLFYLSGSYSAEVLKNQLEFDLSREYPTDVTSKIMGFQGCVWTEEIPSEEIFELQVFPRLQALSETCWTNGTNLYSFNIRLKPHLEFLKANNIHYSN